MGRGSRASVAAIVLVGAVASMTALSPLDASGGGYLGHLPQSGHDHEAPGIDSMQTSLQPSRGSRTWDASRTGLVDVAVKPDPNMTEDSVVINVTFSWSDIHPGDRNQTWAAQTVGPRYSDYMVGRFPFEREDGAWEYTVVAGGQRVEVSETLCDVEPCDGRSREVTLSSSMLMGDGAFGVTWPELHAAAGGGPVHFLFAAGGVPPDEVEVRARWEGTTVRITALGSDATAWATMEDFRSAQSARIDTPTYKDVLVHRYGEFLRDLATTGKSVMFRYTPFDEDLVPPAPPERKHGFTRPDGRTIHRSGSYVSNLSGTWTFWDESSSTDCADCPILWAWETVWTRLPWEDGYEDQADIRVGPG